MIVYGRNACIEALKNEDLQILKVYIEKGQRGSDIASLARERGVQFVFASKEQLEKLAPKVKNQGVVLETAPLKFIEVADVVEDLKRKNQKCFFVICSEIEDPHNLGAIIRSCDVAGVNLVIVSKNNSCKVSETVAKTSAGSLFNVPIAVVSNIANTIEYLKKQNIFVYACEAGGRDYTTIDYSGDIAIVVGGEDKGVKPIIKKACDEVVEIKNHGKVNSLNASVAAAVVIFEAVRQRN